MKSHISQNGNADIPAKRPNSQITAAYKRKVAAIYIGSILLAANETKGIGGKRLGMMLNHFGEWLAYLSGHAEAGVGYDILIERLEERDLRDIFEALIPSEDEFK